MADMNIFLLVNELMLILPCKYYKTVFFQWPSFSERSIAVRKVASPLRELTCHMGSHSVTCHPAEVMFPPLPQPKLVLD